MPLRAILQFGVILIGVLFESIRMGQGQIHPFLLINLLGVQDSQFIGTSEWLRQFIYYSCEHLKFIVICLMMWLGSRAEDFKTDRLFVMLAALDFFDYIFWGNNLWFSFTLIPHENGYGLVLPMSMNVFSLIVFGLYILKEWRMNGSQY